MGQLRFNIAPELAEADPYWQRLAFLNHEGLPYRVKVRRVGNCIVVDRADSDSGYLLAVWKSSQLGEVALSTGTLIERAEPYLLSLELARGTFNRLRNQAAFWQQSGIIIPSEFSALSASALQWFAQATTSRDDFKAAEKHAALCLETTLQAMLILTKSYARQSFEARQQANPKPLMMTGVRLEYQLPNTMMQAIVSAMSNTFSIPMVWSQIEKIENQPDWNVTDQLIAWAQSSGKRICAGPLIELDVKAMPEWLVLWEGDYDNLLSVSSDFVRRVVERYKGKVQIWNAASKINTSPAWPLTDEQRLRLTLHIVEVIRQADPRTPIIITLDQPGGEGLMERDGDLTPIQFVDTLIRSNIGIAGIGLEYNIGLSAGQSLPRDPLHYCQQMDFWSLLNLPAILFLKNRVYDQSDAKLVNWLSDFGPVLLSKAVVQGFFWNALQDKQPSPENPAQGTEGGLFDVSGKAKPIVRIFQELTGQYGN